MIDVLIKSICRGVIYSFLGYSLMGCVQHSIVKSASPLLSETAHHSLMVSRDARYPMINGSLIRFAPSMTNGIMDQPSGMKAHYQWLSSQLSNLLAYRGFIVTERPASLHFAAALYAPPVQKNTDALGHLYRANQQSATGSQSLSLVLRIYRRGALDPLWQGAVDDYATRLPDGQIKVDQRMAHQLLIRLLRTIPMTSS